MELVFIRSIFDLSHPFFSFLEVEVRKCILEQENFCPNLYPFCLNS